MPTTPPPSSLAADWRQLEDFVDQLHEMSRAPMREEEFYQQLLNGGISVLAADGGAIWLPNRRSELELCYQVNLDDHLARQVEEVEAAHRAVLQGAMASLSPRVLPPQSGAESASNPTSSVLILGAVPDATNNSVAHAVIELFMRPGSSPEVEQGWQELLATVCQIASEFHVYQQLRTLQADQGLHEESLALLRRIHRTSELQETAFEVANEGRRFVGSDRLSVLVMKGRRWRLLAASGVDRIEAKSDTTKGLQRLAERVAAWGEPLAYHDATPATDDLPDELAGLIESYVDQSHARRIVAVPVVLNAGKQEEQPTSDKPSLVIVAEQFHTEEVEVSRQRVIELATLCEPAIRQSLALDRFPVRGSMRWAERFSRLGSFWGMAKAVLALAVVAGCLGALVGVPCEFEIEAPATLRAIVERDIFATANGTVEEVLAEHGALVAQDEILAVLDDPELDLEFERVLGDIETVRKKMEAIAVARTDRDVRDDLIDDRLPLSAEAQQLEKRLASLLKQHEILLVRKEALTLRSPIAGKVITLDVQKLLHSRPVQRGQVLFTVVDTSQGWYLETELGQDRVGYVLQRQQMEGEPLSVRFRLAGEVDQIHAGRLASVSDVAVLSTAGLEEEPPAIRARIEVTDSELTAARPGMSAEVRIACGKRSLGFVWLHDVWDNVYSWLIF